MQIEQQLFPSIQMFGDSAGSAGAESGEGALQIALARLLPALLKAQVTAARHYQSALRSMTSVTCLSARLCCNTA